MHISTATAARLLALHQAAFDNVACSRSVLPRRSRPGLALSVALLLCALALAAFASGV